MNAAPQMAADQGRDVARGERFEFGRNWSGFLARLDDRRSEFMFVRFP